MRLWEGLVALVEFIVSLFQLLWMMTKIVFFIGLFICVTWFGLSLLENGQIQ